MDLPAALKLRFTHPNVERPYRVPGRYGMWAGSTVITLGVVLGSWVAIIVGLGLAGYLAGAKVRRQIAVVEGDTPRPAAPLSGL